MRKLDPATFRTMPWKNGGGTTTEVLTLPASSDLDNFEARVSSAEITTDGPFSRFDGVDRTLVVTSGAGITLDTTDGASVFLDTTSRPFAFTGEDPCFATLKRGAITDVNIMTRRSALHHHVVRVTLDSDRSLTCAGALTVFAVLGGELVAKDADGEVTLVAGDFLALYPGDPLVVVEVGSNRAEVLLIDFTRG